MTPSAPRTRLRASTLVAALVAVTLGACGSNRAAVDDPNLRTAASTSTTLTATATASATTASTSAATPPTTAATLPPTTTTLPQTTLPTPQPVPPEDEVQPEEVVGRIAIARLGLDLALFEGITLPTLDKGPGHWPGTAMPGQQGNVVIAGHRVSHTRPFRYLDKLDDGDGITFTVGAASYRYVVTGHEIVGPDAVRIVDQTPAYTATLFACHPPGSTEFRWVVHLELVP